jgi:bacillithiol system protein YtxJ
MEQLTSLEQFHLLMDNKVDRILFKHSGRCSISWWACKEVAIAIQELNLDQVYMLDVFNTGELKYDIANILEIKHESPQVIIFTAGRVIAHASHSSISKGWIINAIKGWHDTRSH